MKKTIFILDDDQTFREMLVAYIDTIEEDIEVINISNFNSFILKFNEKTPDLVFLDVVLPGISGLEILKFLRKLNCKCKIVIMSGFSNVTADCIVQPDAVLEKPFDLEKVGEIINKL